MGQVELRGCVCELRHQVDIDGITRKGRTVIWLE